MSRPFWSTWELFIVLINIFHSSFFLFFFFLLPTPWSLVPGPWSLVPGPWSRSLIEPVRVLLSHQRRSRQLSIFQVGNFFTTQNILLFWNGLVAPRGVLPHHRSFCVFSLKLTNFIFKGSSTVLHSQQDTYGTSVTQYQSPLNVMHKFFFVLFLFFLSPLASSCQTAFIGKNSLLLSLSPSMPTSFSKMCSCVFLKPEDVSWMTTSALNG